jgi:hypothetical protein
MAVPAIASPAAAVTAATETAPVIIDRRILYSLWFRLG